MEIAKASGSNIKIKTKRGSVSVGNDRAITLMGSGEKSPFVVNEPGEYEVEGMSVFGYFDNDEIVFVVQVDEVRVLLTESMLSDKLIEEIDVIDVVILGLDKIRSKEAGELVEKIEPSYVIPYGEKTKVEAFVKDFEHGSKQVEKLVLNKATITDEITEVIVLSS